MGKQEEIRCLDVEGWWSRQSFGCAYNYSSDWECLVRLNQLIAEADHLLYGHNEIYPMYYEDQGKKIEEVGCNFTIYLKYVDNLPNDIKAIDHAFYVDIKSNAVQELSEIKQEKYSVQEGALAEKYGGVTLGDYVVGCRVYDYQNLGETTIELTELQEFSEMLQSTFHELAQANDVETEDYILQMLENGEYDHQAYHPGEDFRSGLLDTVTFGVKPMLEMIAGEDFVTGEEMTDTLRKEKSIEVIMGMVAVAGIPLTKIGSQGAKGFVAQLGIEMATGAVGYTIYETGEAIDLPPGLTMVATLAGGALTYRFLEGRILRVGVAEGVSASALDSLDDGLKSVDDIVERPIKTSYGKSIDISDQNMYQLGQHYNKHGRDMGYSGKKEYEQAARNFFEQNRDTAEIYEGIWNSSRGGQSGQTQIIVRQDGKQLIINKETGQIIDFYEGTSLDGFINIERVQ